MQNMASRFPIPLQNSVPNQNSQSGLNSAMVATQSLVNLSNSRYETFARETRAAMVATQSLVNLSNSRYETFARETRAAMANMVMSDYAGNRNTNSMAAEEMNLKPSDAYRGSGFDATDAARRRSSVSFTNQPPGSNVKVYDPNSTVSFNTNVRGPAEQPKRSALKLTTESNAPLYDRPGQEIQLGSNDMVDHVEEPSTNGLSSSDDALRTKMQYFDNPTIHPRPETDQQGGQIKWEDGSHDSRLPGVDTKPAGIGSATGEVTYQSQILVEVKVVFVRVIEVDTIGQQFEAEIYLQARWPESQFAGYTEEQLSDVEFRQCWNPMLVILNIAGYLESDRASMLLRYEPDRVYPILTYMWHVKGVFLEIMELQHFPLDVQEISIVISSDRSIREVELVCDYSQLSNVSPRALQGNQEWSAYRHVDFIRDYNTLETVSMTKHPILVAAAHIKRKLGFYFWNVVIIVMLILALSFTTLGISPELEDRLIVTVTLFLTCIAFKLVVKTTLPNLSYLTYLDIYVIFALVYLTLQAIENSIMIHLKKFKSTSKIEVYDEIAQGGLIALLVIFHLMFIIYIQVTAFSRHRTMSDKELDFEIAKINLNKKAEESINKGGGQMAGIDPMNGTVRPNENSRFTQPPLVNQQGPMQGTNPYYNPTQTTNPNQPLMGNQQAPIEVTNPLFNPSQAANPPQQPMGNQQPYRPL